ncbi:MAG: flagellar brake protein [Lachnospiraceae bacterium]|nr:flagellar brake protein [Lachnospiraceae bacterium]
MTLTELVRPGEKIDIMAVERAILGSASNKKVYSSKIYDIIDDEQLEILMPMEGSKLILLPKDGQYQFCFYTKKGLYQCFVRIADRYKSNNVYILLAEVTSDLEKFQRREYYRYSVSMPLKARTLMEEEVKDLEKNNFHMQQGLTMTKCEIRDISGGGLKFISQTAFTVGEQIALVFSLNFRGKETVYELAGEVLSCREIDNQKGKFEHRLKFTSIMSRQREAIIRFIFEEERKKRSSI